MFEGGQQAAAHDVVVLGDHVELPVITAEVLQESGQLVDPVHLGHDLDQGLDEVVALSRHRDGEHAPHLWVLQEQVGVEEQR